RNAPVFDRIVVYDLGLTPFQRRVLGGGRGGEPRTGPAVVLHWRRGPNRKTSSSTPPEGQSLVLLAARPTAVGPPLYLFPPVLGPLDAFFAGVRERGYFVVSQGALNGESTPSDYYALYGLGLDFAESVSIAAGILAFDTGSRFYRDVIMSTYEDALRGRTLGF